MEVTECQWDSLIEMYLKLNLKGFVFHKAKLFLLMVLHHLKTNATIVKVRELRFINLLVSFP
jgi:hypothetical protein